jgi:hypothetical protein
VSDYVFERYHPGDFERFTRYHSVISKEFLGNVSDFKASIRVLSRLKMRFRASKERLESVCRASLKRLRAS